MLPQDDYILLSLVNTSLRDGDSFGDFCAKYGAEEEEVKLRLSLAGFAFDEKQCSFKPVGDR